MRTVTKTSICPFCLILVYSSCLCSFDNYQHLVTIWVITSGNVFSDMCAHRRIKSACACSLIRVFVVRMKKHCIPGYPKRAQWRFRSDCANVQSDLNLRWAPMSDVHFLTSRFISGSLNYWTLTQTRTETRLFVNSQSILLLLNFW